MNALLVITTMLSLSPPPAPHAVPTPCLHTIIKWRVMYRKKVNDIRYDDNQGRKKGGIIDCEGKIVYSKLMARRGTIETAMA